MIFCRIHRLLPLTLSGQAANFAKNRCRPCDWKRAFLDSVARFLKAPCFAGLYQKITSYCPLIRISESCEQGVFSKFCWQWKSCHCKLRITSRAWRSADSPCYCRSALVLSKDIQLILYSKAHPWFYRLNWSWVAIYSWAFILKPAFRQTHCYLPPVVVER